MTRLEKAEAYADLFYDGVLRACRTTGWWAQFGGSAEDLADLTFRTPPAPTLEEACFELMIRELMAIRYELDRRLEV